MDEINLHDEEQVRELFNLSRNVALRGNSSNGVVTKFIGPLNDIYYILNHFDLSDSEEVSVSNGYWGVTFIQSKGSGEYEAITQKGEVPKNIERILKKLKSVPYKEPPISRDYYHRKSNFIFG